MGVTDRTRLAALFAQQGTGEGQDIATQRAQLDAMSGFFPPVEGFEATPATVGGIAGEWVRGKLVRRNDAALLYLHGGGYVIGSAKSHRHMLGPLSGDSGLPIFSVDYRLAPEHPFPAALDDAVLAYKGLLDSGIAPANLAIAGDSAGGGLTVATLVAIRERGLPLPACAVPISPWVDLALGGESYRSRAKRDPIVTRESIDQMAAAYLAGADARTPLASPIYADLKGLPPLLIQVGTEEALYDDALALKARAEAAGVDVTFESWGGMIHVWHFFHPILSEGRDALARIGAYLKARIA